ncbi:MAG: hypothetical protein U0414_31435 [Polyangiaceae bacterium]
MSTPADVATDCVSLDERAFATPKSRSLTISPPSGLSARNRL